MKLIDEEKVAERLAAETGLPIEEARMEVAVATGTSAGDNPVPGPDGKPRRGPSVRLDELTDAV